MKYQYVVIRYIKYEGFEIIDIYDEEEDAKYVADKLAEVSRDPDDVSYIYLKIYTGVTKLNLEHGLLPIVAWTDDDFKLKSWYIGYLGNMHMQAPVMERNVMPNGYSFYVWARPEDEAVQDAVVRTVNRKLKEMEE